jgi:hypothetical protein
MPIQGCLALSYPFSQPLHRNLSLLVVNSTVLGIPGPTKALPRRHSHCAHCRGLWRTNAKESPLALVWYFLMITRFQSQLYRYIYAMSSPEIYRFLFLFLNFNSILAFQRLGIYPGTCSSITMGCSRNFLTQDNGSQEKMGIADIKGEVVGQFGPK